MTTTTAPTDTLTATERNFIGTAAIRMLHQRTRWNGATDGHDRHAAAARFDEASILVHAAGWGTSAAQVKDVARSVADRWYRDMVDPAKYRDFTLAAAVADMTADMTAALASLPRPA